MRVTGALSSICVVSNPTPLPVARVTTRAESSSSDLVYHVGVVGPLSARAVPQSDQAPVDPSLRRIPGRALFSVSETLLGFRGPIVGVGFFLSTPYSTSHFYACVVLSYIKTLIDPPGLVSQTERQRVDCER